jgi:hypothetical protein
MNFRVCSVLPMLAAFSLWTPFSPVHAPKPQSAVSKTSSRKPSSPEPGSISNGVYRNPFFGISYKIPFGWVERTAQMREDSNEPHNGQALLAVFERPPEATGNSINSAVVIAAETVSSYPSLKTAADYFIPLTEVTTAKGFKVVNEPYDFSRGSNQLVRGDFSKELGTLTMHQASLVTLKKGYVVSFTFIGGSDDEVEELMQRLSFASSRKVARPKSAPPK